MYTDQREQIDEPRASSTPDVTYKKTRDGDTVQNFQVRYENMQSVIIASRLIMTCL